MWSSVASSVRYMADVMVWSPYFFFTVLVIELYSLLVCYIVVATKRVLKFVFVGTVSLCSLIKSHPSQWQP